MTQRSNLMWLKSSRQYSVSADAYGWHTRGTEAFQSTHTTSSASASFLQFKRFTFLQQETWISAWTRRQAHAEVLINWMCLTYFWLHLQVKALIISHIYFLWVFICTLGQNTQVSKPLCHVCASICRGGDSSSRASSLRNENNIMFLFFM